MHTTQKLFAKILKSTYGLLNFFQVLGKVKKIFIMSWMG